MTKKIRRVPYTLKPCKEALSQDKIRIIIRGAEDVVYHGGRSLLAKILKGSKDKKVIELNLDKNLSYGFFKNDSIEIITSKIDWMIDKRYLDIEYDYRLPFLAYKDSGLKIAKDLISDEYFKKIKEAITNNDFQVALSFKDKNRDMVFILLEKICKNGDNRFIPFLEFWKKNDYKNVQAGINNVITDLNKKQLEE